MARALHLLLYLVAAADTKLSLSQLAQPLDRKHWNGVFNLSGALPELQQLLLLYSFEVVALDVPF